MNYSSEILIRNYKLSLLTDNELPSELKNIDNYIKSFFDNLQCLISDNDLYKDYEFYIDSDTNFITELSFKYIRFKYVDIVDIPELLDHIENNLIYDNELTSEHELEDLTDFLTWYFKNIIDRTLIDLSNVNKTIVSNIVDNLNMDINYDRNANRQLVEELLNSLYEI